MGRPLSKLHQTHLWISSGFDICNTDICNIRTMTRFHIRRFPQHMEAQGFVSKNDRLEKADRQTISQGTQAGSVI
jgi:hypothetical protein